MDEQAGDRLLCVLDREECAAAAGFEQTSVTLEEAAQNLGAPPLKATFRVAGGMRPELC